MAALPPIEFKLDPTMRMLEEHPTDEVVLHHTPMWWIAEFRGPLAERMKNLAGSDTVTTGFNGSIPGSVVCQALAALNPSAKVWLANAVAEAHEAARAPRPATQPSAAPQPPADQRMLDFADEIVGRNRPAAPARSARERAIERALRLKRRFGLIVACSYLREKGWSFEEAHRTLLQAEPRKA